MGVFRFEAMDAGGKAVKSEVEASDFEDAKSKVRSMGLYLTKLTEKAGGKAARAGGPAGAGGRPRMARTAGRVPLKLLTQFTRQLATLQDAGLPILRCLRILENQQKPGPLRIGIRVVADDVEGGATLSEAMAKHPKAFNRLYCNMINAGEAGGVLDLILNRLADFMERSQALKRKVVGAMIYPVVVILFAILIVTGIMVFVIPKFEKIFVDFNTTLPATTQLLLSISRWFAGYGWAVVLLSPVVFYGIFRLLKQSEGGRYFTDQLVLGVPLFGTIVRKSVIARFTRTLGTLIHAGVPILEALNITRDTTGNEVFARALNGVHDGIREGESFAGPLKAAKIVDPLVVNMIDVGEETGDLDKMLEKVAKTYEDEVETAVASLVSLLEPLLVIGLGSCVGFIVISLFMPLVALIKNVTGGTG
ncbi:MAG: type II secretion system F family protein [Phycisphaerae bacterium]|nr:type II secretion system F family protein [Phycisphaerae bacterium]